MKAIPAFRSVVAVFVMASAVAVFVAGLAFGAPPAAPAGKGLFLLVRHAERVQSAMTDDAPLTDAGRARAQKLATMLAKAGIDAIYVTRFQRTKDTAQPLADALRITPNVESETTELVAKLRQHVDETVLVVGHSDTVPDVIKAFGGPSVTIGDDDFGDLFVLVPGTGALTRLAY
jgi:broad specificity phosphatase PhoE